MYTNFMSRALMMAVALVAASSGFAQAGATNDPGDDPGNDFLPTYVGPKNADLAVAGFSARFNGSDFRMTATLGGNVGLTQGAIYTFGIDRGTNAAPFGAFAPNILFDAFVVVDPAGTSTLHDRVTGAIQDLTTDELTISGDTITVDLPLSLLPSEGFVPGHYLADVWPSFGRGSTDLISDFAPESDLAATVVEPASLTLLGLPIVGLAFARRKEPKA